MASDNHGPMKAIILAAGRGMRLRPHTQDIPKALLLVGTLPLIMHQIRVLRFYGIKQIIIVVGYKAAVFKKILGNSVTYVINKKFAVTNNSYSLWCARDHLHGTIIVSMGDSIFHPGIIRQLMASKKEITTMVDSNQRLNHEAFKAIVKGNRFIEAGRGLSSKKAAGEFLALTKFSGKGTIVMRRTLQRLIKEGITNKPTAYLLKEICKTTPVHVEQTRLPWIEIDTPDDLERAKKNILPKINRGVYL